MLALNRGEKEDVLKVNLEVDEEAVQRYIALQVMRKQETVAQAAIRMWLESRDLWAAIGGYGALGCCRVFTECFRAIWGI